MPDHNQQTIETIAKALYEDTCRQSKDEPEDWADDAAFELYGDDVRNFWRQQARAALDALPQPDAIPNYGPGWYEVIHPSRATTEVVYVHEDGSLYCPDASANIQATEFACAASRNRAHRLVRADAYVALVPVEADHA